MRMLHQIMGLWKTPNRKSQNLGLLHMRIKCKMAIFAISSPELAFLMACVHIIDDGLHIVMQISHVVAKGGFSWGDFSYFFDMILMFSKKYVRTPFWTMKYLNVDYFWPLV